MSLWTKSSGRRSLAWLAALPACVLGLLTAHAVLPACAAGAEVIQVPREISDRTALEFSGAVWSNLLSRYVLVSDDVTADGAKHAPLIFTLGEDARLDPTPIVIDDVAELNDLESITGGPDDTLFVATSHSLNKHGKARPARRRLVQLALAKDRHARIVGQIDLTTARTTAGTPPWGSNEHIDIEALAFRDGSLYIGLKAPLDANGNASIWRLADAVSALRTGVIPDGAVTLWARPRLCVSRNGSNVCEGVADMAFLPNGSLMIAANSPKNMPSDGGGSLFRLATPNADPVLLKHFKDLKPEGIAVAPNKQFALVVFDRDGKEPLYVRWRL